MNKMSEEQAKIEQMDKDIAELEKKKEAMQKAPEIPADPPKEPEQPKEEEPEHITDENILDSMIKKTKQKVKNYLSLIKFSHTIFLLRYF